MSLIFGPDEAQGEICAFVLLEYIFMVAVMTAMLESENIAEGWKGNKNVARTCTSVIRVLSHACEARRLANRIRELGYFESL